MNRKLDSKKDMNEYKIVIPMSDETIKKIKSNAAKAVLGASIAGVMIAGGQSVKASSVQEPTAIRQTFDAQSESDKKELSLMIDEILTSKEKKTNDTELGTQNLRAKPNTEEASVENISLTTNTSADKVLDNNNKVDADTNKVLDEINEVDADTENKDESTLDDLINFDGIKALYNKDEKTQEDSNLGLSDEKPAEAQKAGETATTEPNYTDDEKKIQDYSGSERYKETDLQPGDTNQGSYITDQGEAKDGLEFNIKNPSATSPSKTEYGWQIIIDKETGQRTYTKVYVTDSGNLPVNPGEKPMMGDGEKISAESPDVTYKPDENTEITASRSQRNMNYEASEETLKHINNKDNSSTSFGMKDDYTKENPGLKFFGDNFSLGYKVNPWPNENDKLELMKLNGQYTDTVFVQGQDIDTGIKVDNIDENARERLVGQVYNPINGDIVPGASAYIDDKGIIHIQMPEGALIKEDGKYVVNKKSIFSNGDYKALQNLDVKFFARPRTAEEFRKIAETPDDFGETGTYVETGAESAIIKHKDQDVTIDKQGIDRYDHYNLIGDFKLNLDDTRYYDQAFKDYEGNKIDEHSSTRVFPGQDFSVEIQDPETAAEIDGAYSRGEASGKLKEEFLDIANKQIAKDLGVDYDEFITSDKYADSRWIVDGKSDNISKFTIRAPKQAKAGDFLALPVEYTYTNGSTDTHWFHFVVQETNNNKPEYLAEVGPQGNVLVNNPIIPKKEQDLKKNQPESYELIGKTFKDNKGNVWNVSIDQKTGAVTATLPVNLPDGKEINGGEKLTVPVKVKYTDKDTGEERTEEINAQFIATKQHKTLTSEEYKSEIPFETEIIYDAEVPEGLYQEVQAGQNGELTTIFIQDTLNGKKGVFLQDGTFKEGDRVIEAKVTKDPVKRIIKIGAKPASTTVEIPFDTEYVVDDTLEAGKTELISKGEKGEILVTTIRDENNNTITIKKETTKEAKNKKIKIGTMTKGEIVDTDKIPFKYKVEFDKDFYKNYPDATENYKIVTPGQEGENTKTWTIVNSQKVGDPKIDITDPVDAVIKVGQKDYTGTVTNTVTKEVPYKVIIQENPELEAGKSNVKQKGVAGSKTFEYSGEIFNGDLKEGTTFTEKEVTDKYVAPTDHIIEIGTKPAKNEKSSEEKIDVDVTYIYDDKKDKTYLEIGELVPGKVTTKVENVYNPETGEIETKETVTVTNPTRTVIMGTKGVTTNYVEEHTETIPYKTDITYDPTLIAGETVVEKPGIDGQKLTKTEVTIVDGKATKGTPQVTESKAQNQIIRVGTMTEGKHSYTEKLPYKYEIKYDENLKAGEYVIDVEGAEGTKTTEWTIKNSKVVEGSASVTEHTLATNAKIRVGKKDFTGNVSHEVKEEIPYDVKIIEDPTMIAGTSEVVTEGKAGSKTTKYTQGIKNGEADGDLQSEVTAETKPTQQVIKVGTKPAENNKDYDKDVNVKVEYVYDENLDKGVVKLGDLTKGKVEIKTVNKYDPKTGEITTTEEEIVTEATQKIVVGTKDFTGTYKYDKTCPLPFEVVIKEDPNLAKGEKEVDQEGQAGSKTTYYEQDIKNGQPDGKARELTEKTTTQQPKNHIVRIGTKVAESSTVKTVDREIPFETEYIYDENLEAGKEVVESEGKVGKEKVTITTKITDGTGETSEEIKTITEKEDRKVRIGTKPVTKEEAIPQDTTYTHNPNLEAGKIVKKSDGTPGKVTITTTFNKETGKIETKVERTEPTKAVYEYGSKTEGSFKVESEIPFNVKVIEDDTLDAGTHVVDKEGVAGKKETIVKVKNSKEESREDKTITEAVDKIIRVGTKPNSNMCPAPKDPENSYDPPHYNNPGGDNPEGDNPITPNPIKPGEEDSSKPNTPDTPSEGGTTNTGETPSEETKDSEAKPETSVEKEEKDSKISEENNNSVENNDEEDRDAGDNHKNLSKTDQINKTKQLPKTGDGMNRSFYGYTMGLIGSALLALGAKKKKNDTVDEK